MKKIKYVALGIVTAVVTIFSFPNTAKACEVCEVCDSEYININDIVAVNVTEWGTYFYFSDGTGYWLEGIASLEGITNLDEN